MSYARFGWDGSDVYIFLTSGKEKDTSVLECCACSLQERELVEDENSILGFFLKAIPDENGEFVEYLFPTTQGILDHLKLHEAAGHFIPPSVVPALLAADAYNFGENAPKRF